jgi:threonyl-tRNA synthetase
MVIPITDAQVDYAKQLAAALAAEGVRVAIDDRDERMQAKVREFELEKIPFALVVGKREVAEATVSVRSREEGNLGAQTLADFLAATREARERGRPQALAW